MEPLRQRLISGANFFVEHQKELDSDKHKEFVIKFAKMVKEYLAQESLLTN